MRRCSETMVIDDVRVQCARKEHEEGSHSWIKDGKRYSEVINGECQPNTIGLYD